MLFLFIDNYYGAKKKQISLVIRVRGTKDIHTMKYKNGNSDDTGKAEKERIIEVRISEQWNLWGGKRARKNMC